MLGSGLPWGLMLYGEEEEKFLEVSTDPILSAIWKVSISYGLPSLRKKIHLHFQGKEEVPLDENYEILERVADGNLVFIDYKNGLSPQIEIKYTKGNKVLIHMASHR